MTIGLDITFWLLAAFSVVPAAFSVMTKRAGLSLMALMVTVLSVAAILIRLGSIGLGIAHLLLTAVIVFGLFLVSRIRGRVFSDFVKLNTSKYERAYLVFAGLIFVAILYLVANTGIWLYDYDTNSFSFLELLEYLLNTYFLPFVLLKISILILLLVGIAVLKRRAQ